MVPFCSRSPGALPRYVHFTQYSLMGDPFYSFICQADIWNVRKATPLFEISRLNGGRYVRTEDCSTTKTNSFQLNVLGEARKEEVPQVWFEKVGAKAEQKV